jgi:hypothetical protein
VRVATTGASSCTAVVDPASINDFGPVQATGGGVSWVRETHGEFGGGTTVLASAALGEGCSVTPLGNPRPLNYSFIDTFAVDGTSLYLAADGTGVVARSLGQTGWRA